MKKIFISALLSMLFATGLFAGGSKEGTFTMVMESTTNEQANMTADFFVRPGKVLMQLSMAQLQGMKVNMIMDAKEKAMFMVMDATGEKNAIKMRFPEEKQVNVKPVITETTEKKVIDGYNCHKITVKVDGAESEIWVTNDVDMNFDDISSAMSNGMKGSNIPSGYKGFPIQIIATIKGGDKMTISFKNIKNTPVDPKLFDLTGYKITEMDMPSSDH